MRKFGRKPPTPIPGGAVLQLSCGWDFFRSAWGNEHNEHTIDAMRQAWRDRTVRDAVTARTAAAHGPGVRPFAQFLFGPDGRSNRKLTAADVVSARDLYRLARDRRAVA